MEVQTIYERKGCEGSSYFLGPSNPLELLIETALQLDRPLLVTGEPGTGKTQLAHWAAWHLASSNKKEHQIPFLNKPFVFDAKSYSLGKDLLYSYDAVSHFRDKGSKNTSDFICLNALGQAIAQTWGKITVEKEFSLHGIQMGKVDDGPRSSVVLIDEIDKAPRDFPNDLLHEIETNSFNISEINKRISRKGPAQNNARILVIITSNGEKNLPDAFLRRCIFYSIPFPEEVDLMGIIVNNMRAILGDRKDIDLSKKYEDALTLFSMARKYASGKKPATGELLDWIKILHLNDIFDKNISFADVADWMNQAKRY